MAVRIHTDNSPEMTHLSVRIRTDNNTIRIFHRNSIVHPQITVLQAKKSRTFKDAWEPCIISHIHLLYFYHSV